MVDILRGEDAEASILAAACSGPPVEEGLFLPTWEAGGAVPAAIAQGILVEEDRCLFLEEAVWKHVPHQDATAQAHDQDVFHCRCRSGGS